MCIVIPAQLVSVDGTTALVDVYGDRFTVSLIMMPEPVEPGDFVAIHVRRYAINKVDRDEALAARRLFEDFFPDLATRTQPAT